VSFILITGAAVFAVAPNISGGGDGGEIIVWVLELPGGVAPLLKKSSHRIKAISCSSSVG